MKHIHSNMCFFQKPILLEGLPTSLFTQGYMAHMPGSSPQTLAIHSIEIMLLDF